METVLSLIGSIAPWVFAALCTLGVGLAATRYILMRRRQRFVKDLLAVLPPDELRRRISAAATEKKGLDLGFDDAVALRRFLDVTRTMTRIDLMMIMLAGRRTAEPADEFAPEDLSPRGTASTSVHT